MKFYRVRSLTRERIREALEGQEIRQEVGEMNKIRQKLIEWLGGCSVEQRIAFDIEYSNFEKQYEEFKNIVAQIGNPQTLEMIKAELMSDNTKLITKGDKRFDDAFEHYIASGEGVWALLDAAHAQGVRQAIGLINKAEEGNL